MPYRPDTSDWLERLARAGLVLVAVSLPFELRTPLVTLPGLSVTNVELVAYAALILWLAWRCVQVQNVQDAQKVQDVRVSQRRLNHVNPLNLLNLVNLSCWRSGTGLVGFFKKASAPHMAAIVWAAALFLSAALAPADRAEATKFALRSAGGIAVFFAAADLTRSSRGAATMSIAIVGGAMISALTAAAEMWVPAARMLLAEFKTQSSYAGGFLRASGTFQYANTAAMYWEAALPLTLAIGVWATARQGVQRWRWLATAGAVVIAEALVLSASRAALWVTAFVAVIIAATAPRTNRLLRAPATWLAAALIVLTFAGTGTTNLLALRLLSSKEATWLQATFDQVPATMTIPAGDVRPVALRVRNTGMLTWPDSGRNPVHVSYHWYKTDGATVVVWDGARTTLPKDIDPGREASLSATVYAAVPPGQYVLEWDVVREHIAWFSTLGTTTVRTRVDVEPASHPRALPPLPPPIKLEREVRPSRTALWRAAYGIWRDRPLFGAGADNFRHHYGPRLGLTTFDDRTHASSLYIETLANTGVIGLLAFAAVPISLAAAFRRRWLSGADDEATRALMIGIALALATFLMHGLVDYFHSFTPTYGLFWLLAGLVVGTSESSEK